MVLPLDPDLIRTNFPAFADPSLKGQAFFENAGGSYICTQVIDRLTHYYRSTKVQPYYPYPASTTAGNAMELAYIRLAAALNVPVDWIHIGPSTTANSYTLSRAMEAVVRPGDAIVVTNQDHEANSGAWRRLSAVGAEVREWAVDPGTGHLDISGLKALLGGKVKFVAFPHVSNIVGEINPVAEISALVHEAGAYAIVDGVSYAPHGMPDIEELGADLYMFSAYKTYGPHQGVMAINPELAAKLPNQGHYFNADQPRKRLIPAGPDHAQVAALAGVADYLEAVAALAGPDIPGRDPFRKARNAMRAQEQAVMAPLVEWLSRSNRVRLIGTDDVSKRAPTLSVELDGPANEMVPRLARHGIMSGGGQFYANRLIEALGIAPEKGVLRLSMVHYTSPEEVAQLIDALDSELGSS